ncbi:MAG: hypothetical protein QOJ07_541 [Thermoleophilaceae bacterium]|nr:hypothetical protein [Thermoleophilaceae bacterium]
MTAQGTALTYEEPRITDHGALRELTQAHMLVELSHFAQFGPAFAASVIGLPNTPSGQNSPTITDVVSGGGGGGGGGGVTSTPPVDPSHSTASGALSAAHHTTHGGSGSGPGLSGNSAVAAHSGSGSDPGGAGGKLPFTGFALAMAAGAGMAMASTGAVLRRVARRR